MADRPVIANLDFDEIKDDIVEHFKSKSEFTDYEFTGSALNLLMDILSYNTHYYSLASNFLLNESFLDTALLRKNVVSLAKRLNYTPRSISSAFTTVTIAFDKQDANDKVIIIPAGTLFNARDGNSTLNFYTVEDYVLQFETTDPIGTTKTIDVTIKEGKFQTQAFTSNKDYTDFSTWSLRQNNIDTSTLVVAVNGTQYKAVLPEDETIFSLGSESSVYFIEENREGGYNLIFGNNIAGKAIKNGDQIIATYLSSNGVDGNGIKSFTPSLPGRTDIRITRVHGPTQGGADRETIQSIKDNAPKWFQAQYRAVTTNDYEVVLKKKFADIQAISVYGGEDVGYPGKVFICIKPKSADKLSAATKEVLKQEVIRESNVVTVRPEFIDPNIFGITCKTVVVYDKSRLATSKAVLEAKVKTLYDYVNQNYIGNFLSSFRESNFSREIKDLDPSVISSNTRVEITTNVTASGGYLNQYRYDFNNKLYHPQDGFLADKGGIFKSSLFYRAGRSYQSAFDEDGYGNIRLYDWIDNTKVFVNRNAGRINYETGSVEFLYDFDPQDTTFTISVVPESVDVIATQNMILEINQGASTVDAIEIQQTDLLKSLNLSRSV